MGPLVSGMGQALLALLLRTLLIVVLAWGAWRGVRMVARYLRRRLLQPEVDPGRQARLKTLLGVAIHALQVAILATATLMILQEFGVTITPVLTGVGVMGLAVSLGAQALIRDFIGGLLILMEDQFHEGDVIQVGATIGTVEQIRLRTTSVRDELGRLWIIPNGEVRIVSNQTRGWARAVVDLDVPAAMDAEAALSALASAMARLYEDAGLDDALLEIPQVYGWHGLTDQGMQARLTAKTAPGKQWAVARVIRQYAAEALRGAGPSVVDPEMGNAPRD